MIMNNSTLTPQAAAPTATQTRTEQLRANQNRTTGEKVQADRLASGNYDQLPGGAIQGRPTLPPSAPDTQPGSPSNPQRGQGVAPPPTNVADALSGPAIRAKGGK
jgi:hypothetical protein